MAFLARKTMEAIELALYKDQGAKWRGLLRKTMAALEDAYRDKEESHRSHLGASLMGKPCARALWYDFHWATGKKFAGRMVRLFNRGHMEEGRVVALLELIGIEVFQFDENGKQYKITGSAGHYGGSGDGILKGVPDLPSGERAVFECKTFSLKTFTDLVKRGVRESKYEHWAQMQQYMTKWRIGFALYTAVCKDNDEIYMEIVVCDPASGQQLVDRADKIIWMQRAPDKFGNPPSPGNMTCRWCDHNEVCWKKGMPDRNCRTCVHARPTADGAGVWACGRHGNMAIPKDFQPKGCNMWERHMDMGA